MEGKLGGILLACAIAIGLVWFKYNNKGTSAGDLRLEASALFADLPDYDQHAKRYETYCDEYHQQCFDQNYNFGSRRTSSSFDEHAYWNDLLTAMIDRAKLDRNEDMANHLRSLRTRVLRGA